MSIEGSSFSRMNDNFRRRMFIWYKDRSRPVLAPQRAVAAEQALAHCPICSALEHPFAQAIPTRRDREQERNGRGKLRYPARSAPARFQQLRVAYQERLHVCGPA